MYNGESDDVLTILGYVKWNHATATYNYLRPTEREIYFHSLRVHLQVSCAKNLGIKCLSLQNRGWNRTEVLVPIRRDLPAAPENILKVIRCKCKITSRIACGTVLCTRRKNPLKFVPGCGDVRGLSCNNPQF